MSCIKIIYTLTSTTKPLVSVLLCTMQPSWESWTWWTSYWDVARDPLIPDARGMLAVERAERNGHTGVVERLRPLSVPNYGCRRIGARGRPVRHGYSRSWSQFLKRVLVRGGAQLGFTYAAASLCCGRRITLGILWTEDLSIADRGLAKKPGLPSFAWLRGPRKSVHFAMFRRSVD